MTGQTPRVGIQRVLLRDAVEGGQLVRPSFAGLTPNGSINAKHKNKKTHYDSDVELWATSMDCANQRVHPISVLEVKLLLRIPTTELSHWCRTLLMEEILHPLASSVSKTMEPFPSWKCFWSSSAFTNEGRSIAKL